MAGLQDASKKNTPVVRMHLRQKKPPSLVQFALAGVAVVLAVSFGAKITIASGTPHISSNVSVP